jgi:hypothetical protein
MEFKLEHIALIIVIICIGYFIMKQTPENFNVLADRRAYPLNNLAGNSWTKEFDRPAYYTDPDGTIRYIPEPPFKVPKSIYKEEIYDGDFEIPQFNYENMPVPVKSNMMDVDETEGSFLQGVAYDKMPESEGQQHYIHLKRQMQMFEQPQQASQVQPREDFVTEQFTEQTYESAMERKQKMLEMQRYRDDNELRNLSFRRPYKCCSHQWFTIVLVLIVIVLLYKLYKK